jgi:hypothetical protein
VGTAGSGLVVGVAVTSAAPAGTDSATDAAARPEIVTVVHDMEVEVMAAAALKFGDPLKSAATGQVAKWVTGTDAADLKIGVCRDQAIASGAKGNAFIRGSA